MRYAYFQAEKALYPLAVSCRVMGVTRSGFYTRCRHPLSRRAQENRAVLA